MSRLIRTTIPSWVVAAALILLVTPSAHAALSGTVTEAGTGARLGGVSVQAFCWQVAGSDPGQVCGTTQTGIDGTYSLSLAPGTYKVFFDHWPVHRAQFYGGGTNVSDADSLPVDVSDGAPTTGIDAALVPLRPVTGAATSSGAPVSGINVTAYRLSSASGSWDAAEGTVTGPDGAYALYVPSGTYRVGFSDAHGPYQTVFFDGAADLSQADDVVVGVDGVPGIDADMGLNHPITGRVTVDGVNMPGVTVTALRSGPTAWEAVKVTTTILDGTYALYLPDGTYRVGFVTWQGRFAPVYYDGAGSLDMATDVTVDGAEVPNIDARIGNPANTGPAITGTVVVAGTGGPPGSGVTASAYRWSYTWGLVRTASVQPDGSFALYVPEGTYRVEFSHPFNRYRRVYYHGADTVDVADDIVVTSEGAPNVDQQLVENHHISGTVTADLVPGFPPGPPPTLVTAWRWNAPSYAWDQVSGAFSTPDGSYVLYVPDGTYRVAFTALGPFRPLFYDGAETLAEADDVTVSGGNVSNIDAHLRGIVPGQPWPPAVTLSGAGQDAWAPQVAAGPDGAVTAVWYRRDGHNTRVQVSTLAPDEHWSSPRDLSLPGEDAFDPRVAMGARGTAVVVWRRWDGGHYRVQASSRGENKTWSSPVSLSPPGEDAWDPQVAMGPHGMSVVVWRLGGGTGHQVQATTRVAYGPWSSPAALSTAGEDAWDPHVAIGWDGTATVVWSRSDGTHHRVRATSRARSGAWSSPATLSEVAADAWNPQVAAGPSGTATVVWHGWDGSSDRIQASSRSANGVWSTAATLSTVSQDVYDPQVAVDPDGMVTAVWSWFDGQGRVQAASRAPNGTWSRPVTVSRFDQDAQSPQVAAGPGGRATVVWRAPLYGVIEQVMAAARAPDGSWSAQIAASEDSMHVFGPRVATGSDGTVVAVWERRDGGHDRVQGVVLVPVPENK